MKIKIAPSIDEITRNENVLSCDFNNIHLKWVIAWDCSELSPDDDEHLKRWLCNAIAVSSKLWQVPFILNSNMPFKSEFYVDGEKIDDPCTR